MINLNLPCLRFFIYLVIAHKINKKIIIRVEIRAKIINFVDMKPIEIEIGSREGLADAARRFLEVARPGAVYAFRGAMGAGKTTFIAELCRRLESADEASSPTFSIVNVYDTVRWGRVYHLDCYRLESEEEGYDIGVEDYFASGCACFVEWPEKIEGLLPEETVDVELSVLPDGRRLLRMEAPR